MKDLKNCLKKVNDSHNFIEKKLNIYKRMLSRDKLPKDKYGHDEEDSDYRPHSGMESKLGF